MPNLLERVAHESIAGVSQTGIFPAQYNRDLGGENLLCTVDPTYIDDPDSNRDLGRAVIRARTINPRRRVRAARVAHRHRQKNHGWDWLHQFLAVRFSFRMRSTSRI